MANENNFFTPTRQDNQNFKFDAVKSFNENIRGIDDKGSVSNPRSIERLRSNINIDNNKDHLHNKLKDFITGKIGTAILSPETTPQESRCHTFYRIIGFPIISKNNGIYNPGHDIVTGEKKITRDKKATIASDPIDGFFTLSEERERYVNTFLKLFGNNNQSIDSCVTCLSGINIRDFISPFKNPNPLEEKFDANNQAYDITDDSIVGYNDVKFIDYVNSSSKTFANFSKKRYHIIKPFAVDPRIDISVPVEKKLVVPFTLDPANRIATTFSVDPKTPQNVQLDPPMIEAIILKRFIVDNQIEKSGKLSKETIEAIKNIEEIKDEQIIKDITSGQVYGITQQQYFVYYLNIIRAMVVQLAAALGAIEEIQSNYYWLPIPSTVGPENGCTINEVFYNIFDSRNNLKNLQTEKDKEITINYLRSVVDNIMSTVSENNLIADVASYTKKAYPLFFDKEGSSQLGNTNENQLKLLQQKRVKALTVANQQLQIVELIMGEFSGFGLSDMIAIMGGLHLMPAESLLGFLDDDAYDRAKKTPALKGKIPDTNPATINLALKDLSDNVKSLYNIMDKLIEDTI